MFMDVEDAENQMQIGRLLFTTNASWSYDLMKTS